MVLLCVRTSLGTRVGSMWLRRDIGWGASGGRSGALLTPHRAHIPVSRALHVAQGIELGGVGLL